MKNFQRYTNLFLIMFLVLVSVVLSFESASALEEELEIRVRFFSLSGATLEHLSEGSVGEGILLYYAPGSVGEEKPALAVQLEKVDELSPSVAKIYDDQTGNGYVDLAWENGIPAIVESDTPTIIMTAPEGWWVREGVPNYTLDIEVWGPVCAMWGAGPECGGEAYQHLLRYRQLNYVMRVRDPAHTGIPEWEFRSLIPSFSGLGFVRTNYAERKCDTPTQFVINASPQWPYVAQSGEFLQAPGQFRPPIVVDWPSSRVTIFSEIVSVRSQNCSYNLYSITPLQLGEHNTPDFEAPFAFYDLSGNGIGQPNLIVRMGHFYPQDRWLASLYLRQPFPAFSTETIRYSWSDDVGDGTLDYKVDLFGFHEYQDETPIAGGDTTIDAPSYLDLPSWVIEKAWPSATFVDATEITYGSSEGIYDWSSDQVGLRYLFGLADEPDLSGFETIPRMLRGEFRYRREYEPVLYFSPLDKRLHLLYAEGGLWNLGGGQVLREYNSNGGPYIDSWVVTRPETRVQREYGKSSVALQSLHILKDHLLYSDIKGNIVLKNVQYTPSLFTLRPPTDQRSWQAFRQRLQPFEGQAPSPENLGAWLEGLEGSSLEIRGGFIKEVESKNGEFWFTVYLEPGFETTGDVGLDLRGFAPGDYIVTFQDGFHIRPFVPVQPQLAPGTLTVSPSSAMELRPLQIDATIYNPGLVALDDLAIRLLATSQDPELPEEFAAIQIAETEIHLDAGQSVPLHFQWIPPVAGTWQVTIEWGVQDEYLSETIPVQAQKQNPVDISSVWQASNIVYPLPLLFLLSGFILSAAIMTVILLKLQRLNYGE